MGGREKERKKDLEVETLYESKKKLKIGFFKKVALQPGRKNSFALISSPRSSICCRLSSAVMEAPAGHSGKQGFARDFAGPPKHRTLRKEVLSAARVPRSRQCRRIPSVSGLGALPSCLRCDLTCPLLRSPYTHIVFGSSRQKCFVACGWFCQIPDCSACPTGGTLLLAPPGLRLAQVSIGCGPRTLLTPGLHHRPARLPRLDTVHCTIRGDSPAGRRRTWGREHGRTAHPPPSTGCLDASHHGCRC